MSNKKNDIQSADNKKSVDKFNAKQQKRAKEAAKAKRNKMIAIIVGIVLAVALAAFILSFPIRNWNIVHSAYIDVNGESVTRVEYAYFYNNAKQSFISENSSMISMYGVDATNIEQYQYTEDMSFSQYFTQKALENLLSIKGMRMAGEKAGFEYDVTEDLAARKAALEEAAAANGATLTEYMAYLYGSMASWDRLEDIISEEIYAGAYFEKVQEDSVPTDEEIEAEYKKNSINYDLVDYRLTVISTALPETDENGNSISYTDDEILKAAEEAKVQAKEAEKTIAQDGEAHVGEKYSDLTSTMLADYLYYSGRKAGDTTILSDSTNSQLLVVAFEGRYPDTSVKHDVQLIISNSANAQTILDAWEKGTASEEYFLELVETYDTSGNEGSLYSGVSSTFFSNDEVAEWLSEDRKAGDVFGVDLESGHSYVFYYLGGSEPAWITTVRDQLLNDRLTTFMSDATSTIKMDYVD